MIRTVTVYTGESDYAQAAQEHAIEMARQFSARLKVIEIWEAENGGMVDDAPEPAAGSKSGILEAAERAGVRVVAESRGEGMPRSLLEEARETDLLVLGVPTNAEADETAEAARVFKKERPLLRKADCALLVVNQPPAPIRKILARYEEGSTGKAMLRMVAAIAERYQAHLGLLTIENDSVRATELAAAAAEYVKGFDIPEVQMLAQAGPTDSKVLILHEAESFGADLIVMGEEGHGWLKSLLSEHLAEQTAFSTSIPLLIVR